MNLYWAKECVFETNCELLFVKEFDLVGDVELVVTASSSARLFVNGQPVWFGPKRGAEGYAVVSRVSVRAEGKLVVCLDAMNYGINSYQYATQTPFVGLDVFSDGEIIANVASFACHRFDERVKKVERYSCQRNFIEFYDFRVNPQERYSGRFDNGQLALSPVYGITVIESEGCEPSLEKIAIDNLADKGDLFVKEKYFNEIIPPYARVCDTCLGYTDSELECRVSSEASRLGFSSRKGGECGLIDNGYETYILAEEKTGWFSFCAEATENAELFFIFDEISPSKEELEKIEGGLSFFNENDKYPIAFNRLTAVNVVKFRFEKGGKYRVCTMEPYTFKYLKIACSSCVKIGDLSLILSERPKNDAFDLKCSDEGFGKVVRAAVNTFNQNAIDIFMDCPSRERAGWLCDSFFLARSEKLLTGSAKTENAYLTNYLIAPPTAHLPEEMFPMCYPSTFLGGNYIPNWALWLIIQLYDGERSGRNELAAAFKEKVIALLKFFERYLNEYGLLESLDKWIFIEWSDSNWYVRDLNFPTNMLYAAALEAAGKAYGIEKYVNQAEEVRKTIYKLAYNGTFFVDHAMRENGKLVVKPDVTETCQYYALFFMKDLCAGIDGYKSRVISSFGTRRNPEYDYVHPSNAFIGNFLRLEILRADGEARLLYDECINKFLHMANRTGTLWENMTACASCNHGFASYVVWYAVGATTGLYEIDEISKKIVFNDFYCPFDLELTVPLGFGKMYISVHSGKRRVTADGYEIIENR